MSFFFLSEQGASERVSVIAKADEFLALSSHTADAFGPSTSVIITSDLPSVVQLLLPKSVVLDLGERLRRNEIHEVLDLVQEVYWDWARSVFEADEDFAMTFLVISEGSSIRIDRHAAGLKYSHTPKTGCISSRWQTLPAEYLPEDVREVLEYIVETEQGDRVVSNLKPEDSEQRAIELLGAAGMPGYAVVWSEVQ